MAEEQENMCLPSVIFILFSLIQIFIDIANGFLSDGFMKIIVTYVMMILLNILCKQNLEVVAWIIVFIPFIFMSVIISLLGKLFKTSTDNNSMPYTLYQDSAYSPPADYTGTNPPPPPPQSSSMFPTPTVTSNMYYPNMYPYSQPPQQQPYPPQQPQQPQQQPYNPQQQPYPPQQPQQPQQPPPPPQQSQNPPQQPSYQIYPYQPIP